MVQCTHRSSLCSIRSSIASLQLHPSHLSLQGLELAKKKFSSHRCVLLLFALMMTVQNHQDRNNFYTKHAGRDVAQLQ